MKKIIVIGGGTAGWLTALVVNKFWTNTEVTLIESSKIGILGAGEGGTSNFGKMLTLLEINHQDFYERTKSTIKSGIHLHNWTGNDELAKHLFYGEPPNNLNNSYAYHFDARLVAKFFKEIAIDRGVKWVDGEVDKITNHEDTITNLTLNNGDIVDLDFVFDCSGFKRLVIEGVHKEEWVGYEKYLLLNKAATFFLPQTKEYSVSDGTHTKMVSMDCGWMFQIPLQHRWGCGYVFNDKYKSVEDIKLEIEQYVGHTVELQKVFDFKPGVHKRSWIGNSISIGLSYGFIEPLEATSLMSTIMQLKRLIDVDFNQDYMDRYNKFCSGVYEQNLLFIRYHYLCNRDNTQFWRDCTSMPIPPKLKRILDKNNSITTKNDVELLKSLELEEISVNELTFFMSNYQTIFMKNKKTVKKELI